MIRFPLSGFIIYIGADHKSHYQRKKALQIFKDLEAFQIFKLQTFTLEDFDDFEFCSSVIIIPYLKVRKNGKLWTVNVDIAKELYEYKYPFQINEYFLTWKNIYQLKVYTDLSLSLTNVVIKMDVTKIRLKNWINLLISSIKRSDNTLLD